MYHTHAFVVLSNGAEDKLQNTILVITSITQELIFICEASLFILTLVVTRVVLGLGHFYTG